MREVEDMTLWEIVAYIDGKNEAHGKVEAPSDEEFDDMLLQHGIT